MDYRRLMNTHCKSPLNEHALSVDEVKPGVEFVIFHIRQGVIYKGMFLGLPEHDGSAFVILVNLAAGNVSSGSGCRTYLELEDVGLIPQENGQWHPTNFVIARCKQHLLPCPQPY